MIEDNSLQNRLNAVKNGEEVPKPANPEYSWAPQVPEAEQKKPEISFRKRFLIDIYQSLGRTLGVLMASLLYGYGLAAIFEMDWTPLGALGVGFLLNHSLTTIPLSLKKLFTKNRV